MKKVYIRHCTLKHGISFCHVRIGDDFDFFSVFNKGMKKKKQRQSENAIYQKSNNKVILIRS